MTSATDTVAPSAPKLRPVRNLWLHSERYALLGAWLVVVVCFSIALPNTFFTVGNLQNVLGSQAVLLVLALGLLFPLTAGEFDLSAASTLSVSSMTVAVLNAKMGVPIVPAIVAALVVGIVIGLLNGVFVVVFKIDSFIVTLGSATVLLGIVQWMSNSSSVTGVDSALVQATVGFRGILGMPMQFFYGLIATAVILIILTCTPIGRRLLFVGRGRQVAELSGLNVGRLRIGAFTASGLIASIAGIIYAGSLGGADPSSGQSFLLPAFAACYLGATAIVPGRFNAVGTFIAVFFLFSGVVGLQMLGAQSYVQQLFYGGALIVAVALSQAIRRQSARAAAAH
jgi:ribose transport system permease protein